MVPVSRSGVYRCHVSGSCDRKMPTLLEKSFAWQRIAMMFFRCCLHDPSFSSLPLVRFEARDAMTTVSHNDQSRISCNLMKNVRMMISRYIIFRSLSVSFRLFNSGLHGILADPNAKIKVEIYLVPFPWLNRRGSSTKSWREEGYRF